MKDNILTFLNELKVAARSLGKSRGLTITVIATLALGIGANAAIFTLVRGVLLRPLANRDEDRLIYIRQSTRDQPNEAFSIPEIRDLSSVKSFSEFGTFSTIGFTMVGLGEPREVRAGVVDGNYFRVMGLRPVLGRLLGPQDDGPNAAGAVVLTYRFWTTSLKHDPSVLHKTIRLGTRMATIVGVLQPSVPYPAATELIANIVTSPHHLSATMVTGRVHRMTELFGRLAPGATLESARAELQASYGSMVHQHSEDYPSNDQFRISAVRLRDQITSGARNVLLVLLIASGLVFIIACSNVANLILARTVRREGELAIRAALGATTAALRRTLLAESTLLCGSGALLGVLIAPPMVAVLARYASRFSVRALDLKVDASLLWVGALLAILASALLAFVPRLPASGRTQSIGLAAGSTRVAGGSGRRLRIFAMIQIAASFVLLAGASMLLKTLLALESVHTGFDLEHVLVLNVPVMSYGRTPAQVVAFYKESMRRIQALPGVDGVSVGANAPWRDAGDFSFGLDFNVDGHVHAAGEQDPRARFRIISPGFFASVGVPLISGRDFNDGDRSGSEPVVIVSRTLAERMFPHQDALNHHIEWTDPVLKFVGVSPEQCRIVGIAEDADDENVLPRRPLMIYHPFEQTELWGGRLFVHTHSDPYALVPTVTRIIRGMGPDQPVERAATLQDIRAEVLTPDRLNTVVFGGFAIVALVIAIVGVAGVLAFSVSGRTREFGIRLAIGSQPRHILTGVIGEGAVMALSGIAAGAICGFGLAQLAGSYIQNIRMPGALPLAGSILVLLAAAVVASVIPAARAARVDVMQALRSE